MENEVEVFAGHKDNYEVKGFLPAAEWEIFLTH